MCPSPPSARDDGGEAVAIYLLSCYGSAMLSWTDTAWVGSGSAVGNSTINLFPLCRACVSSDMAGPLSSFHEATLGVESCCVVGTARLYPEQKGFTCVPMRAVDISVRGMRAGLGRR